MAERQTRKFRTLFISDFHLGSKPARADYLLDFPAHHETERRGVDGVICGHIHHAAVEMIGPIKYINTGDWVDSRTAVAEECDGAFSIMRWDGVATSAAAMPPANAAALQKFTGRAAWLSEFLRQDRHDRWWKYCLNLSPITPAMAARRAILHRSGRACGRGRAEAGRPDRRNRNPVRAEPPGPWRARCLPCSRP